MNYSIAGLDTLTFVVEPEKNISISAKIQLPVATDSQAEASEVVATVTQNGATVLTTTAGADGFGPLHLVSAPANDAIAASLEVQDLTYTAVAAGESGNSITINYVPDGVSGSETVDVVGSAITVHMDDTAESGSTADDIAAAIAASTPASALVSVDVTGDGDQVQTSGDAGPLMGGLDAGYLSEFTIELSSSADVDQPLGAVRAVVSVDGM